MTIYGWLKRSRKRAARAQKPVHCRVAKYAVRNPHLWFLLPRGHEFQLAPHDGKVLTFATDEDGQLYVREENR